MLAIDRAAERQPISFAVEPSFDFGSAEYRALHGLGHGTAFQQPRWLDAIHRDLMPRIRARQHTVTLRRAGDRQLLGVLPLAVQRIGPLAVMQPADFGVCDANAVVADPAVLEDVAGDAAARRGLAKELGGADVLFFRKVRRDGFDVRRLFDGAVASPCENAAYHSDTGGDFEAWQRRTIRRKLSKELGRLGRQAEREFGAYEHRLVTSAREITAAFAFLGRVRRNRFRSDLLDDPAYAAFYRDFAIAGAASGDALTYVSTLAGEPVAVLFGVGRGDEFHAVQIGVDTERFARFSVGTQILYRVIKLRSDAGLRRLDFGLGNTGYKSMFRVEETGLDNVTVACSLAGTATAFVYHNSKPVKTMLRQLTPRLR